jgi:hypothetical protein
MFGFGKIINVTSPLPNLRFSVLYSLGEGTVSAANRGEVCGLSDDAFSNTLIVGTALLFWHVPRYNITKSV